MYYILCEINKLSHFSLIFLFLQSHTYCVSQLGETCNFGSMRNLILPPFAIKVTDPECLLRRQKTPRKEGMCMIESLKIII